MGLFWSKNGGTCLDDDNGGNMEHHGTCLGRIPPSVQVPWRKKSRRMWGRRLFQWHLWVYLILFAQTCQGDFQQVRHIHMKSCFTHRLALPTAASLKTSGSDIHIRSIRATRAIQQLRWQFLCLSLAPGLKVCNICLRAIHHFLVTLWRTENVILACGPLGKASIAAGAGISRHCHQWSQSFWFTKFVSFRGWEFAWSFWIRIILENFRKLGVWDLLCPSRLYTQHLPPEDSKVWCLLPPSQYLQQELPDVPQVPEVPEVPQRLHNWHSLAKTRLHFHLRSLPSQLVSGSHAGHSGHSGHWTTHHTHQVHSSQPSGRIFPIANHVCHGPTCDHSSHSSHSSHCRSSPCASCQTIALSEIHQTSRWTKGRSSIRQTGSRHRCHCHETSTRLSTAGSDHLNHHVNYHLKQWRPWRELFPAFRSSSIHDRPESPRAEKCPWWAGGFHIHQRPWACNPQGCWNSPNHSTFAVSGCSPHILDRGPLSPAGAFTEMPSGPSAVACKMPLAFHRPVMVSEIDVC